MNRWWSKNKQEVFLYAKFVYMIASTILLTLILVYLLKHPQVLVECQVKHGNGTIDKPGLYGNCKYMTQYVRAASREDLDMRWEDINKDIEQLWMESINESG